MQSQPVELIGFPDDDALHEVLTKFRILSDYRAFLREHLAGVLREQHPKVQIRKIELLEMGKCNLGGFPSAANTEHILVDTFKAPLDLRLHISTNGSDLHELEITLNINAINVRESAKITTDMRVRNHKVIE